MTKTVLQQKLLPMVDFFVHQWLGIESLLTRPRFEDHSVETVDELHEPRAEPADAIEEEEVAAFDVW